MTEFTLNVVANERPSTNGKLAPRVILEVGGEQRAVQRLTLESDQVLARVARRWSQQFDIDEAKVVSELQGLSVKLMAQVANRRKRRGTPPGADLRISELADEFLSTLEPQWHRKHRAIYFQSLGREVALSQLWTLANDTLIDQVLDTAEAHEAARDGPPPAYRVRLALLEKALAMAGARLVAKLPAVADVTKDDTLDQQNLLDSLVAWLLAPRSFRTDTGTPITITYHGWALALTPGAGWLQCFTSSTFGRITEADGKPEICVKAEVLRAVLKYETTRRLIGDLERSGYAKKTTIKVARCAWRVLLFDSKVLDAISTESGVT